MFRRSLPLWLVLAMVAGSSARAQSPFPRDIVPGRLPLERLGLERQWFAVVPLVETERLLRISRTQDLLFAQTSYARLHTFDAETGRLLWSTDLGERSGFARGVASNSWAVFVTNANMLFCLDRGSGRPIWRENLDTIPTSTPACDESRVMVGMTNGMIKGYRLKQMDNKGIERVREKPIPLWSYHAGGAVTTRPLLAESLTAIGGGDNKAWVVFADEPTILYRVSTGGPIAEGLAGHGTRTLLIPSADKILYAVDLFTARMLWTFATGAPVLQEPLVADQEIFVINNAGDLFSVDPIIGQPRWMAPTQGGRLVSVTPSKIYLRSYNLDLFVVDRATGRMVVDPGQSHLRSGLNLREYDLSVVNRFNDRMYFATKSGMILAIREIGLPDPKLLRDPKQPPFGYIPPEGLKDTTPTAPETQPATTPEGEPAAGAGADANAAPAPGDNKPDTKKEAGKEPE
jgi:outer membrane protein assembly factor BamB